MVLRALITFALCLSYVARSALAFSPVTMKAPTKPSCPSIFSTDGDQQYFEKGGDGSDGTGTNKIPEDQQYQSLTKQDPLPASDMPTQNRPLLGEVPVDGSLVVLAPAVVIGVVGFICSIYVTFNSGDEYVQTAAQNSDDTSRVQASIQAGVYDPNVCRGICAQDQEGLKNFMQSLRK